MMLGPTTGFLTRLIDHKWVCGWHKLRPINRGSQKWMRFSTIRNNGPITRVDSITLYEYWKTHFLTLNTSSSCISGLHHGRLGMATSEPMKKTWQYLWNFNLSSFKSCSLFFGILCKVKNDCKINISASWLAFFRNRESRKTESNF